MHSQNAPALFTKNAPTLPTVSQMAIGDFPATPGVVLELINCYQQPETSVEDIARHVRRDPILYLKVISSANTAAPLSHQQLENFDQILLSMGISNVKTLVISAAVGCFFDYQEDLVQQALRQYWLDAQRCALAAKAIAVSCSYPCPEEAYLAGLLHNLGQLTGIISGTREYSETLLQAPTAQLLEQFEQQWFGETSAAIGAEMVRTLLQQSFLADAIYYQQQVTGAISETPQLVRILNLAVKLCARGMAEDVLFEHASQLLGLPKTTVEHLLQQSKLPLPDAHQADLNAPESPTKTSVGGTIKAQLGQQIAGFTRRYGLSHQSMLDQPEQRVWQQALQDLKLLFGLEHALALRYRHSANQLNGVASYLEGDPRLQQISLPVAKGRSLPAQALIDGELLITEASELFAQPSVADEQLSRYLRSQALLCLPLACSNAQYGVIVVGISLQQRQSLPELQPRIEEFITATVARLAQHSLAQSLCQQALDNRRNHQLRSTRAVVRESANPLGIINNYLAVLNKNLAGQPRVAGQLQIIATEVDRLAKIIAQIKDLEEAVNIADRLVNINQLLADQVEAFQQSLSNRQSIRCDLRLDAEMPLLEIEVQKLQQILSHLLTRAAEAMPEGGRLQVSSRNEINVNGKLYVEVSVSDSGSGISQGLIPHVFSQPPSNKDQPHRQLTLAMVKTLVADLRGYISCSNKREGGTEFVILLPYHS